MSRIFTVSVASVYPHYVTKVEKKGRSVAELHQVIEWLTGYDESQLQHHLDDETTFEDFFAAATINPDAAKITGSICGVRVQDVEDPLMQKIRYLDKLVDEVAKESRWKWYCAPERSRSDRVTEVRQRLPQQYAVPAVHVRERA